MVVVKFQYGNDVRRITLPSEGITYEQLLSLIESLYQARPGDHPGLPQEFKLKYADEENDFIGFGTLIQTPIRLMMLIQITLD